MKPVMQTIGGEGKGNCFPACIASILEVPLESMPNFCADYPASWWQETQRWLAGHGLAAVEVTLGPKSVALPEGVWCILTGPSPRYDCLHAVVARAWGCQGFELVHDPASGGFFGDKEPQLALFFVPLHPHKLTERPQ